MGYYKNRYQHIIIIENKLVIANKSKVAINRRFNIITLL